MKNPTRPKKRKLITRLKSKYRLVIMNNSTYEEKLAITLTPMNVFVVLSVGIVSFTILISSLIIFTPLKEYIPGYADTHMKRQLKDLIVKADSLEEQMRIKDQALQNIQLIMDGRAGEGDTLRRLSKDSISAVIHAAPDAADSSLRNEFETGFNQPNRETPVIPVNRSALNSLSMFTPLKGYVSQRFSRKEAHYAIDIVSKRNDAVKAALPGTVIFASWTPETGHVIGLQHTNNLVTIYKHNAVLLKKSW